jgi:phosphoribosyl-ATP pyrophosphohydrolase/phosphoribosyl-AMP cyclohydrolase
MIIPSIDIMGGRAVQLRQGRDLLIEGGDPLERLEEFSVAGEVAIVDLDAALGKGSNSKLIREMVRRAPCRVGGGIRDIETALDWLDAGATRVVVGTAASVDFCSQLPRDRVVAAVDTEKGKVVVEGWRTATTFHVIDRIRELAPAVGGFLLTQVEHEGGMSGFNMELVEEAVAAAADARVTAAGGITTAAEIATLDRSGVDAQVGMALYSNRLSLGAALAAPLTKGIDDRLWPTVVCDESGGALGLVWSTRESLEAAVSRRRGIYWSRSRQELWVKGETSGATQELVKVDLDCDRDALRFTVRQHGTGFCHNGEPGCWPTSFDLSTLGKAINQRRSEALGDDPQSSVDGSGTTSLLKDRKLLRSKLLEEAAELADAKDRDGAIHESADVIYFALVAAAAQGANPEDILRELQRRHRRVRRRPMVAKDEGGSP